MPDNHTVRYSDESGIQVFGIQMVTVFLVLNFYTFFLFTLAYFPGTRSPAVGPAPCGVQVPLYSTLDMMPCCVALGPVLIRICGQRGEVNS